MKTISLADLNPAFVARNAAALTAVPHPKTVCLVQPIASPGGRHAKKKKPSPTVEQVAEHFARNGIPAPVSEYRFDDSRRWRFDYAWPGFLIALEVEGGVWTGGRHTRGAGFVKDMEKYNRAAVLRWAVLRVVPADLFRPATCAMLQEIIQEKNITFNHGKI